MKELSIFSAQRSTYFQILCFALERWARTHNQLMSGKSSWRGSKVHQNAELWTELMVRQWNSSAISSQDSQHVAALPQSRKVAVKIERNTREVFWTDHLHVGVQRHLMVIKGQRGRMQVKCSTRLSLCTETLVMKEQGDLLWKDNLI